MSDISFPECRAMGHAIKSSGAKEARFLSLLLCLGRVEATLFLGLGAGALWALAWLQKGTRQVAVIHLMHAVWATAVSLVHMDEAGLLEPISSPDPNADPTFYNKVPIHFVTAGLAVLFWSAFFLSSSVEPATATSPKPKAS